MVKEIAFNELCSVNHSSCNDVKIMYTHFDAIKENHTIYHKSEQTPNYHITNTQLPEYAGIARYADRPRY